MTPKSLRRLSFSSKPSEFNRRLLIGTGLGACTLFIGYLASNKQKSVTSSMRALPQVDSFISIEKVHEILSKNQVNLKSSAPVLRMDINSIASNDPSEDYHSENQTEKATILAIFDGHGGPECGALVSKHLASYVVYHIQKEQKGSRSDHIKQALQNAFLQLDHDIINGSLHSAPASSSWWNPFVKHVDYNNIISNLKNATSGSCALVAYLEDNEIYVASIGDCRAVLGRKRNFKHNNVELFETIELSKDQTARSPTEFSRLCEEHPGEDTTVVVRGRVLGGLMPTRAFGDARYKWSFDIQKSLIPHIYPSGKRGIPKNLLTPPYVTALPEITHYQRDENDIFLILACDGLWDELSSEQAVSFVSSWYEKKQKENYATKLIQAALSGAREGGKVLDWDRIQHHFSIPSPKSRRFRDDMTINVVFFDETTEKDVYISNAPGYTDPSTPQLQNWIKMLKNRLVSKL